MAANTFIEGICELQLVSQFDNLLGKLNTKRR